MARYPALDPNFWGNVDVRGLDECWDWKRGTDTNGYGYMNIKGTRRNAHAHRVAYTLVKGEIAEGLEVCHRCDRKLCCNPNHLFLGTRSDNMRDMTEKGRRYIPKGEAASRTKLSDDQVRAIRQMAAQNVSSTVIGKLYNVYPSTIRDIVTRQTWKHLKD